MFLRYLAVITAGLSISAFAGEPQWLTHRSPSGFYSVNYPPDWKLQQDNNIFNIVPKDESGAVTISAYIGNAAPSLAEYLISETFKTQQPTSPLIKISGSGWKGIRRTFLDTSETPHREWEAIMATNAYGMVLITSNEISPKTADRGPVYAKILRSLKLSTPQR